MTLSDASKSAYERAAAELRKKDAEIGGEDAYRGLMLNKVKAAKDIVCPCGEINCIPDNPNRKFLCRRCRREIWITAQSDYCRIRLFRPRYMIENWFEKGIIISANQAAKLLEVSNDTVNRIYKRLALIALNDMKEVAVEVSSALCLDIFERRSKETPAREHPSAEEDAIQREEVCVPENNTSAQLLTREEEKILSLFENDPVSIDWLSDAASLPINEILSAITSLELRGLISTLPGSKIIKCDLNTKNVEEHTAEHVNIVTLFIEFIKDFFQFISRKNCQIYAVLQWFAFDREKWKEGSLSDLSIAHQLMKENVIHEYITPPMVLFVPKYRR